MQHLITRQHLRHAGIRFPPFSDGRKKLAVLQFNAIHGHRHLGHIDFLVFAIEQVVVTRDIGRGVADIAKEGTQRTVIVKAQRQRTNRAVGSLQLNAHVHGNAQHGMDRSLHGMGFDHRATRLISK